MASAVAAPRGADDVEKADYRLSNQTQRGFVARWLMPHPKRHPREGRERWAPEEEANLFSRLTFTYLTPLMNLGYIQPLVLDDLPDVNRDDDSRVQSEQVQAAFQATSSPEHPSGLVIKGLWEAKKKPFIKAGVYKLVQDGLQLVSPIILEFLLKNVEDDGELWYNGVMVMLLFIVDQARNIFQNIYFHMAFRVGMDLKTGIIDAIFRKSLRVSGAVRGELGIGTIVNYQSNDGKKLWMTTQFLHQIWSAPLQVIVTIALLMRILTPLPALVGLAVTLLFIPINLKVGKKLFAVRRALIAKTDKRVKLTTEVLQGIKAIKLYAWETPYLERIGELRNEELRHIIKTGFLGLINIVIFLASPVLVAIMAFITFVGLGNRLTASVAFPSLALFNLLRFPVMMLPMIINQVINAKVSGARLQKFFDSEEAQPIRGLPGPSAISCQGATFQWTTPPPAQKDGAPKGPFGGPPGGPMGKGKGKKEKKGKGKEGPGANGGGPGGPGANGGGDRAPEVVEGFKLGPIDLEIPKGKLVMVVGEVGSGKTSLLMGLLKEMAHKSGEVSMSGSIAYTSQDPWIQNATLERNVLMGEPMDEARYETAIEAAALQQDLLQLPAADQTEIGEKGVNLSGGQKHRVALARAVYANADIYLLDDPLSAVDAHVGQHLFSKCIVGALRGKTRILVTHQLQFLSQADVVVVLERGTVAHMGSFEDLRAKGVSFAQYEMDDGKGEEEKEESTEDDLVDDPAAEKVGPKLTMAERSRTVASRKDGAGGGLIKAEGRAVGSVAWAVYGVYFTAWGALFLMPLGALLTAVGDRGLQAGQQFWLAVWSNETAKAYGPGGSGRVDAWYYLWVYTALGLGSVALVALRSVFIVIGSNNASRNLGNTLLAHVIRLPMSFFDSQPLGRLLNRFTADLDAIDTNLNQTVSSTMTTLVNVLAAIILMMIITPGIAIAILAVAVVYWRVQQIYVATSREVKRLDSVALSPIFSLFSETIAGLPTVRAFGKQDQLLNRNLDMLNTSNRAYWPHMTTNRWLSVRLETLGNLITTTSALVVTCITQANSGYAGLVISSAMSITGVMNWLVRQVSELEVAMNAVERITEYRQLPTEAPEVIEDCRPPQHWPDRGAIQVQDLRVKYRPELDFVLKGISVSIAPAEKVGVCGRTGCGKSTFMLALYRIVEPASGTILIDGIDVSKIGLLDLRSKLALVPQDPVIFSGTIRSNLDPFHTVSDDADIWRALRQVHLESTVQEMGGLDATIAEAGGNLSVGQRQLLCMARALLRNARILLLDEATSSVDNNTDAIIQQTIREAFVHCTVLTIAHRLHTIIDSDKVMLLDRGNLAEFDAPHALLSRPSSFAALVDSTSKGASAALRTAAFEAALAKGLISADKRRAVVPEVPVKEEARRGAEEGEGTSESVSEGTSGAAAAEVEVEGMEEGERVVEESVESEGGEGREGRERARGGGERDGNA